MNLQELNKETLEYLFDNYLNDTSPICDISHIASKYHYDPHQYGSYLVGRNWVKDQQFLPTSFECAISFEGIIAVNAQYINDLTEKIISTLANLPGQQSLMEVLDFEPVAFQRARDVANYLRDLGLIDVLYSYNDASISLTLRGIEVYEIHGARFF